MKKKKRDYEIVLLWGNEKDEDIAMQALAIENQAAMQLDDMTKSFLTL